MSGAGGDARPPDLTAAVLGFRMWQLRADGGLGAMVAGSVWMAGRNEAICSPDVTPARRPKHTSPHPGCNCGFNAYFGLNTRLRDGAGSAVGAIAAWGEMDVYADGFRAQFAQVIALALPPSGCGTRTRTTLELAAKRYGVPLVPKENLRAEALRHASPISASLIPEREKPAKPRRRRPRPTPPPVPANPTPPADKPLRPVVSVASWSKARGHAIWVRRHAAINALDSSVRIGLAPGAAAVADPDPEVLVAGTGSRVEAGDVVGSISAAYPGERIHLLTPVGGKVRSHNDAFASALRNGDRAVSSAPWLVELEPDDSPHEDAPLLWGRPGVELYRRGVVRQSDAGVLAELAAPPGFDPGALVPLPSSQPTAGASPVVLAAHQRATTSVSPGEGRRAAIMVEHLRPLLQACGEDGTLLAA